MKRKPKKQPQQLGDIAEFIAKLNECGVESYSCDAFTVVFRDNDFDAVEDDPDDDEPEDAPKPEEQPQIFAIARRA